MLIFVLVTAVIIIGCMRSTGLAPVVNGWLQPNAQFSFYRVKAGDTIYSIAWAFGLDYQALAAINNLHSPYSIRSGEFLRMTIAPRWKQCTSLAKFATQKASSLKTRIEYWQPPGLVQPVFHWRWPVDDQIVRRYSVGMNGNQGLDIAGRYGEPVLAAADGIVVYSGAEVRGYGNLIIIKHNKSYLSAYAFNRRIFVKECSRVRAGQKIAEMGRSNTGRVLLHFQIRCNGKPVNPLRLLTLRQ